MCTVDKILLRAGWAYEGFVYVQRGMGFLVSGGTYDRGWAESHYYNHPGGQFRCNITEGGVLFWRLSEADQERHELAEPQHFRADDTAGIENHINGIAEQIKREA